MPDINFNTAEGHEIDRDLLILCLNVGTDIVPDWAPIGRGVEASAAEFDWQRESKRDILGNTYTTMRKPIITQNFDPWPLANGDKAQKYLWKLAVQDQDAQALSNLDCLLIHKYAGTSGTAMFAERYEKTTIEPTSLGGDGGSFLSMPITVTYGGERTTGTASISGGTISFTK